MAVHNEFQVRRLQALTLRQGSIHDCQRCYEIRVSGVAMSQSIMRPPARAPEFPVSRPSLGAGLQRRGHAKSIVYRLIWALLAILALSYMALLAIRPDLAGNLILRPDAGSPEGNFGQRAMTRALAELTEVKGSLARLEAEIVVLRSQVSAEEQRTTGLEERLAALETAQRGATAPVALATPASATITAAPADVTKPGSPAELIWGATIEGAAVARPAGKAQRDIEGVSPAKVAAMIGSPLKASEPRSLAHKAAPVALIVGSGSSPDAVRLSWQLLIESHARTLRRLEPRYIESMQEPGVFQLLAGPVATREEAVKLCERLKAKRDRCAIASSFDGEPL